MPETVMPVFWQDAEPARLQRDQKEVEAFAPRLTYYPPGLSDASDYPHGGWFGELPLWPFSRREPDGLRTLVGAKGLAVAAMYSPAHPMVPPTIFPVSIEPTPQEETQSAWHVAPGGSLCLLQSQGAWHPEAGITELLAKAAGWNIEYALMKAGALRQMSLRGIVSDASFDYLVTEFSGSAKAISAPLEVKGADVAE